MAILLIPFLLATGVLYMRRKKSKNRLLAFKIVCAINVLATVATILWTIAFIHSFSKG
jgi:hypothetical protein